MKRKTLAKKTIALTICSLALLSCVKKTIVVTPPVIVPTDSAVTNVAYTNLVTTDWKGIVWDPFAKDWNNPATIKDGQQIAAAGIQWTRLWITANQSNAASDSMVKRCTTNNIKIVACYNKSNPANDLGDSTQQQQQVSALKDFVTRYKANIKYWEIGNEPNLLSYWNTAPGAWNSTASPQEVGRGSTDSASIYNAGVSRYVKWLHLAHDAIKAADPSATVIMGGVSSYIMNDFMTRFTIEKGYLYCDEVAYHPYAASADLVATSLVTFKTKISAWPVPKNNPPIWITEIGFQDADQNTKAANLTQLMPKLIKNLPFSRPIFWYIFHDNSFGLVSQSVSGSTVTSTLYPAYYAYQGLNQSWSYYQLNGNNLVTNPGFEANGASQTPTGWSEANNVAASYSEANNPHGGTYSLSHRSTVAYEAYTYQNISGLTNGLYTLKAWVKRTGAQSSCQLEAKGFGASAQLSINVPATNTWTEVIIPNINVTNNLCTIGLYSNAAANEACFMDDVLFYKQ